MSDTFTKLGVNLDCRASVSGEINTEVVLVFQGGSKSSQPKALSGLDFDAEEKSLLFLREPKNNVLYVGMGKPEKLTLDQVRIAGASSYVRLKSEKIKRAKLGTANFKPPKGASLFKTEDIIGAFAEGALLKSYKFRKYHTDKPDKKDKAGKKEKKKKDDKELTLIAECKESALRSRVQKLLKEAQDTAEAVTIARDFGNEPSNIATPKWLAAEIQKIAKKEGLKFKVLKEVDAKREKMGLFLSVSEGSRREGQVVVVEYAPSKKSKGSKTIAVVGKGVTFDSGGISIKPAAKMEEMKFDMCGAATAFASIVLASRLKVPHRVVGILAFTENMPGGIATQPGNVIVSRSGKTVEICNTDAEGRLVLADMLDYAKGFKPDCMVDIATLTGACGVALGVYHAGVMGNNEKLVETLIKAGEPFNEKMWQLPLHDDYDSETKSEYADLKNIGNRPLAGAILGGAFLKQFVDKKTPWAHIDFAYTAWDAGHVPYFPKKGASGSQVRTLANFLRTY